MWDVTAQDPRLLVYLKARPALWWPEPCAAQQVPDTKELMRGSTQPEYSLCTQAVSPWIGAEVGFDAQAYRNTVPVPRHWSQKRKYLQGKRGLEKPPFKLPDFIEATGIGEMRQAYQEKAAAPDLAQHMLLLHAQHAASRAFMVSEMDIQSACSDVAK